MTGECGGRGNPRQDKEILAEERTCELWRPAHTRRGQNDCSGGVGGQR